MSTTSCEGCPEEFFAKFRDDLVESSEKSAEYINRMLGFCTMKDFFSGRKFELKHDLKHAEKTAERLRNIEPTQDKMESCRGPFERTFTHENGIFKQMLCGAYLLNKVSCEQLDLNDDATAEDEIPIVEDR